MIYISYKCDDYYFTIDSKKNFYLNSMLVDLDIIQAIAPITMEEIDLRLIHCLHSDGSILDDDTMIETSKYKRDMTRIVFEDSNPQWYPVGYYWIGGDSHFKAVDAVIDNNYMEERQQSMKYTIRDFNSLELNSYSFFRLKYLIESFNLSNSNTCILEQVLTIMAYDNNDNTVELLVKNGKELSFNSDTYELTIGLEVYEHIIDSLEAQIDSIDEFMSESFFSAKSVESPEHETGNVYTIPYATQYDSYIATDYTRCYRSVTTYKPTTPIELELLQEYRIKQVAGLRWYKKNLRDERKDLDKILFNLKEDRTQLIAEHKALYGWN